MAETLIEHIDTDDTQPEWNQVFERIEVLNFPNDDHERANDVAKSFMSGIDIQMFARTLHEVLLPDVSSMPADRVINLTNQGTGEVNPTLEPDERNAFYDKAGEYIAQLDAMRSSPEDDKEFLRRSAYVVGMAIVGAHSFENGNGRTARVLAELIRYGTENTDDIILSGTEREVSKKQRNNNMIFSFQPGWKAIEGGDSIYDTLNATASLNIPLDEKEKYLDETQDTFTTPYLRS